MTTNIKHDFIHFEQADYLTVPWKNGLGSTREILQAVDKQGLRYRISQAEIVENGYFSDFSGLQRTMVLLSGTGLEMTHQTPLGARFSSLTKALDKVEFSGADPTFAAISSGAIENLNIMVRQTDTQATVAALTSQSTLMFSKATCTLLEGVYSLTQARLYHVDTHQEITLAPHSFLHKAKQSDQNPQWQLKTGQVIHICVRSKED